MSAREGFVMTLDVFELQTAPGGGGRFDAPLRPTENDDGNYEGPTRKQRLEYAIRSAHWQGKRILSEAIFSADTKLFNTQEGLWEKQ